MLLVLSVILISVIFVLVILAVHDRLQTREPTLRVYPLVGRLLRLTHYSVRGLHPSLSSEGPFHLAEIRDIRHRALFGSSIVSFGASSSVSRSAREPKIDVAIFPTMPPREQAIHVGGSIGKEIVRAPILNFGALGLGPVNENVIRAVGRAAAKCGCLMNTGEDGLTIIHSESSAPLIWQIGTGYWGCRESDGSFSPKRFAARIQQHNVAMVEVKLSQAAKPATGGFMPAKKNSRRLASMLGVDPFEDIVSPIAHPAFSNSKELLHFLKTLASLSKGRPVGIKLAIGSESSFRSLANAMCEYDIVPDFITIDGAEGGSGAAPSALMGHCGLPVRQATQTVDRILSELALRSQTRIFAAGAVVNGLDVFELLTYGADGCFITRAPMIAMGCIQARKCHLGNCPSGIASHTPWRRTAINPKTQGSQLARFYSTVIDDFVNLLGVTGFENSSRVMPRERISTPVRP